MSKLFSVKLPIAGYIVLEVEAGDEAAAISAALISDYDMEHIEEWNAYEHLGRGNIINVPVWEASAKEIDD